MAEHTYELDVEWTGDTGRGTADYRAYTRDLVVTGGDRPPLLASADPAFLGDPSRYSPEDLLVAALSGCHLLWYLHLCADAGIVVTTYRDRPVGVMTTDRDGGRMTRVTLRPEVTVTDSGAVEQAIGLHDEANARCYVARSVAFPVHHEPTVQPAGE